LVQITRDSRCKAIANGVRGERLRKIETYRVPTAGTSGKRHLDGGNRNMKTGQLPRSMNPFWAGILR